MPAESGESDAQEIDLSELEQALGEDEGVVAVDGDAPGAVSELNLDGDEESERDAAAEDIAGEEIDLSELEQALEGLEEGPRGEPGLGDLEDLPGEASPDLETALSGEPDPVPAAEMTADAHEEIDLSELEEALEETERFPVSAENAGDDETESLSLDLASDVGDSRGVEMTAENSVADEERVDLDEIEKALNLDEEGDALEDLPPELAEESGDVTEADSAALDETESQEEIDLSDIEELLESDEGFAAVKPDFAKESDDSEEGIDISEIEEVLAVSPEPDEERIADDAVEDLDLEFDIEEDAVPEETAQESFFSEDSSDFEFEEEDIEIAEEPAEQGVSAEEPTLEMAPAGPQESATPETEDEEAMEMDTGFADAGTSDAFAREAPVAAAAAAGTAVASAAAVRTARRGGGGRPLLVIFVIGLLLIGGYVAYSFYPGKNIAGIPKLGELNIPYVSQLFQSSRQPDAGNLKIKTSDVISRFVDNAKAGRLFVISGQVVNQYPQQRSAIKIMGRLYVKGKKLVQSQTVMGGAVISDLELSRLDTAQIQKRLSGAGEPLRPGQSQPFMIVFSHLPDNLEEFTIEVVSSQK